MKKTIVSGVKRILPKFLLNKIRLWKYGKNKDIPLQDIFSGIYEQKVWGGEEAKTTDFHSGGGSLANVTEKYEKFIVEFVSDNQIGAIVDLGCGDFQVGQRILSKTDCKYIGVDVVPSLIKRNNKLFSSENIEFFSKNIADDELPSGELCLIREVLQHLDNNNIIKVLKNVSKYKYVLISESVSKEVSEYNLDIPAGHWTRSLLGSGVFIEKPPFSVQAINVLEYDHPDTSVLIRTLLINNK
jgi:SAM-dependent methyltransferase